MFSLYYSRDAILAHHPDHNIQHFPQSAMYTYRNITIHVITPKASTVIMLMKLPFLVTFWWSLSDCAHFYVLPWFWSNIRRQSFHTTADQCTWFIILSLPNRLRVYVKKSYLHYGGRYYRKRSYKTTYSKVSSWWIGIV